MPKKGKIDYLLLGTTSILIVLGILILASVSASFSQEKFSNPFYFLIHQIGLGIVPGILLGVLAYRIPFSFLKKWSLILLLINLLLLAMVFIPKIGAGFGGAARWINLGPLSFQPTEFLKLTFILYLAAWLTSRTKKQRNKETKKHFTRLNAALRQFRQRRNYLTGFSQTLFAFLAVIGIVSSLLILQPDISTLAIIVFVAGLTYFLAGTPLWHTILVSSLGAGAFYLLIKVASYRMERLLVFLKPETDPQGIGYQIQQALMGIGSGGIFGLGLGMSRQFSFLPYPMSDSVFAILAEETGFIGSLILISLFLILAWQGFKIARNSGEKFSQLTAVGITSWLVIQGFVNIGSMIGILPLTGIPLPFISYGGSALIAELIGVGILLNIAKES